MVHIREAAAEDAALISRLIAASWRGAYQGLIDPVYLTRLPDEYWLPSLRAWLSSGRMYGYIAETDNQVVGCVVYGRGRDADHDDWGEIVALYMLPEMTGAGIGSMLLSQALDALHEDGYDQVYLWALEGCTRALRFYEHHGFVLTSDRVAYKLGSGTMSDVRLILEASHG